ncbi:retrovirus-related pol polyprotein from transposon TNT 1-94 [Tanacetum coccineum]
MGEDEAVYKELDDSLVRAATTTSSLEVEQDNGNIIKTRSKATSNEAGSQGTTSGGGPMCQETMRDTITQTSLKLNELMELCTNLQQRLLDLETKKTTQANEIASFKRRVKKLEQKKRLRTYGLKRLYKVGLTARVESSRDEEDLGKDASKQGRRIHDIDAYEDITLVNDQDDADMFDVNTLTGDEVLVEQEVVAKDVNLIVDEVTFAQALAALKSVKPKVSAATTTTTATIPTPRKGIVITELGTSKTATTISSQPSQEKVQDKGKGILFNEEERLAREKDEANVALTEEWYDIHAKVEANYQLAQRLQAQDQEELTDEEKARLFVQFLEQRRKHFAAKRAEEKRNKPPTQAQQRKIMCTYLKNIEGKKPKDLKNKSFDSIQKMFNKAFKSVNTFKKVDDVQETAEVDDDQEIANIKELMEIVPDKEDVAIDDIPLAIKPPSIGRLGNSVEIEDTVWRNQQDYRVLDCKLYDSYGVHSLRMQHMHIYMLVEKRYPLTPATITDMLNKKLQRTFGLRPYHFTYPERRLTMEEMLYKFIDKGKREQEEMRAFIHEFRTTNKLLFKERNNLLSELRFELPSKEKDPGSFTIPYDIGQLHINNALADLGASTSLMPYPIYEKLGLGEPKAIRMSLELADRSIQYPRGIVKNVLIKVDKFVLPIDFVILDMPEDSRAPIILGRPFLETALAMINVFNKKITLRVGDNEVMFDIDQSTKRSPTEDDECYRVDDLENTINKEA